VEVKIMAKKIEKEREMVEKKDEEAQYPRMAEPLRAFRDLDRIFDSFRRDMDRFLWDPFGTPTVALQRPLTTGVYTPKMNIQDKGTEFLITAEMPGMNKENLEITVEDNVVTINAQSKTEHEEKDENYLLQERGSYSFQRCFELPEDIKSEQVVGEMKDGVLHLRLPKKEPAKKKVHKIKLK
jgi:HSP20 family protein